jgi:hypothetical protein
MEAQPPQEELDPHKILEYTEALTSLAQELDIPEDAITEEMVAVGAEMLASIYKRYGDPASDTYKEHHNDIHTLDVLRRGWMLLKLHREKFPDKFTDHDYAIMMFSAIGHDIIHGTGGPMGEDERQSAERTALYMKRAGFSDEDCERVKEIIEATTVRTENGSIIQTNIRSGNKDPLKLQLATADINGVAMEGTKTMINDAFNLCLEFGKVSIQDVIDETLKITRGKKKEQSSVVLFFGTQARFLEERLKTLRDDFAYYYNEEEVEAVNELYEQTFTRATRDAIGVSQVIYRFPKIAELAINDAITAAMDTVGNNAVKLQSAKAKLGELFMRLQKGD